MAVRSKVGLVKDGFMPGKPKKSRQGEGKNTNIRQRRVTRLVKGIVDRDDNT